MAGYIFIGCLILLVILLIKQSRDKGITVYNVYADNDDESPISSIKITSDSDAPLTQDENGNWIPATPEPLRCEIDDCPETENGDWYVRNAENKDGSSWDSEPVYLCKEHGKNHELYKE